MTTQDRIAALLASAAAIGTEMRDLQSATDSHNARTKERLAMIRDDADKQDFTASGYTHLKYEGLARLAAEFGKAFNQDSNESRDATRAMADSFMASFTAKTAKSLVGGTQAGYAAFIGTGANGASLLVALQSRLDHWKHVHDQPPGEAEKPAEVNARKALAKRYLTPCGAAPMEDGSWPKDNKDQPVKPKFNGRPAVSINGVSIPFGRGASRDSLLAAFTKLYGVHGDKVLDRDVVDSFLDNGGKFDSGSGDESVQDVASAMLDGMDKLLALGGSQSADAGFLTLAAAMLKRIRDEGFKMSTVAAPQEDEPEAGADDGEFDVNLTFTPELAAKLDAQIAAEAGEVSEPESILAGEPVTLGAPAPSKRARRVKEVKAA